MRFTDTQEYRTIREDIRIGGASEADIEEAADAHERHFEIMACGKIGPSGAVIHVHPDTPAEIADGLRRSGGKLHNLMASVIDSL